MCQKLAYFLRKVLTLRVNNSRILTIKYAKFSGYYFYIDLNILGDFQICFSVPLSVAYYIEILSCQDTLYFLYLSLCLHFGLYMSYLCIFIFITINHITSMIQTSLFFGNAFQKFSLRVLLSFCLIFLQISTWRCL